MVLDKKNQEQYVETVKNYTTLGEFAAEIFFLPRTKSIGLIYFQSNSFLLLYDLVEKDFKECFDRELIRIKKTTGFHSIKIEDLNNYLQKLYMEYKSDIEFSGHELTARTSKKAKVKEEKKYDWDQIPSYGYRMYTKTGIVSTAEMLGIDTPQFDAAIHPPNG